MIIKFYNWLDSLEHHMTLLVLALLKLVTLIGWFVAGIVAWDVPTKHHTALMLSYVCIYAFFAVLAVMVVIDMVLPVVLSPFFAWIVWREKKTSEVSL